MTIKSYFISNEIYSYYIILAIPSDIESLHRAQSKCKATYYRREYWTHIKHNGKRCHIRSFSRPSNIVDYCIGHCYSAAPYGISGKK